MKLPRRRVPASVNGLFAAALATTLAILLPAVAGAERPRIYAITGARIVTAPGKVIDNGTIVLRNGLIESVGAKVAVPPDAEVITAAKGWTVYPAFIDAASSVGVDADEAAAGAARGGPGKPDAKKLGIPNELTAVHPETEVVNKLDATSASIKRHREMGFAVAQVLPDKGVFRGESAIISLRAAPAPDLVVRAKSGQVVALELGSFMAKRYPSSKMGAVAAVRQELLDGQRQAQWVERYAADPSGMERPVRHASDEALLSVVNRDQPVIFVALAALDPGRFHTITDEFDLKALSVARGLGDRPADLAAARLPTLLPLEMPAKPELKGDDALVDVNLKDMQAFVAAPRLPAELAGAGVKTAFVTWGMSNPRKFTENLAAVVKAGLSPDAALAAVTTVPAELLGVSRSLGTLEPGKQANLFVVEGDLFVDKPAIRHLFVDGYHEAIEAPATVGDPNAVVDPRGTWKITSTAMGQSSESTWTITGEPGNYAGTSESARAGKRAFVSVGLQGNALTLVGSSPSGEAKTTVVLTGETLAGSATMESPRGSMKMQVEGRREPGTAPVGAASVGAASAASAPVPTVGAASAATAANSDIATKVAPTGGPPTAAKAEALAAQAYPVAPPTPAEVLIRNATVWTEDSAGILKNADVLIRKGRIAAIGPGLKAGADALVIDATGRHVTPGIIDAHSHSATETLDLNEGINSISAEVRVRDVLDPRSLQIYQQLAGGVTTIHVLHGSANAIGGQNQLVKLRWGVPTADELVFADAPPTIKFALGENPTQSGFSMPGADRRYPATRMGVQAFIRTNFEKAARYKAEWQRYNALSKSEQKHVAPPRRDLQMDALVEIIDNKRFIHSHSYRADEIQMLARLADELGIKVTTFHHVLEGYRVADEIAAHGASASTFSDWWSYKMEAYQAIPWNAAIMADRGVLVSLNSDDANLARRMNLEAAKMLHYGHFSPEAALATVTINPAKQLKVDQRVGSLAVGKEADVVVWSGDPLSVYSVADLTLVDGQVRFDRKLDAAHRADVERARGTLAAEIGPAASKADAKPAPAAAPAKAAPKFTYHWAERPLVNPVAIVGATVHPMDGPAIADGVVVFANGRITAVGGPGTAVPAGATRIDAAGKHLWPGIIHANTVLGISEIDSVPGTVDTTETGEVNADADVAVAVNAASEHIPVARSAGITHAVVMPSGGTVPGTTSIIRTDGWTWQEMNGVREHSLVIRFPEPPPPQYQAFLGPPKTGEERRKEIDERIKTLDELLDSAEAYGKATRDGGANAATVEFDPQLEALQPVLRGERPVWAIAREKHAIEASVLWAKRRGLKLVITDGRDAYLLPELLAENHVPVVLVNIVNDPPRADDPYDVLYSTPAKLEAAGVPFAIASTTRAGGSSNARQVTLFAGLAAGHGLDREAAYRSLTLYPARILGLDDILGSITPGKSASLVLTDGDLLEQGTTVEQVWIDGTQPSMDDVQKEFWRKWNARPRPPTTAAAPAR